MPYITSLSARSQGQNGVGFQRLRARPLPQDREFRAQRSRLESLTLREAWLCRGCGASRPKYFVKCNKCGGFARGLNRAPVGYDFAPDITFGAPTFTRGMMFAECRVGERWARADFGDVDWHLLEANTRVMVGLVMRAAALALARRGESPRMRRLMDVAREVIGGEVRAQRQGAWLGDVVAASQVGVEL
jgi:hypothetical protein